MEAQLRTLSSWALSSCELLASNPGHFRTAKYLAFPTVWKQRQRKEILCTCQVMNSCVPARSPVITLTQPSRLGIKYFAFRTSETNKQTNSQLRKQEMNVRVNWWISRYDLNMEIGQIEMDFKPNQLFRLTNWTRLFYFWDTPDVNTEQALFSFNPTARNSCKSAPFVRKKSENRAKYPSRNISLFKVSRSGSLAFLLRGLLSAC